MAFQIQQSPGSEEQSQREPGATEAPADGSFRVSTDPVVENGHTEAGAAAGDTAELPASYGSQTLYLMARAPHSLFAYWDIDWSTAFGSAALRERKVHLRVTNAEGGEESALEVEPMAGSCYIDVTAADASYMADIGYYEPAQVWNSVAVSVPVTTPPDSVVENTEADFATVPFHLSFQRIIDVLGLAKHDNESLTDMLGRIREGANSTEEAGTFTAEQQEVVRAIDEALAASPPPARRESRVADAGVQQHLERILGVGNPGATSPAGGFGGSSHRGECDWLK